MKKLWLLIKKYWLVVLGFLIFVLYLGRDKADPRLKENKEKIIQADKEIRKIRKKRQELKDANKNDSNATLVNRIFGRVKSTD